MEILVHSGFFKSLKRALRLLSWRYRLKCRLWKRYNTVRARYLPYTWSDRSSVLPHIMFEILSQFVEQECSPGSTDWEATGYAVAVDGVERNVRDEMQDLYDWWHRFYNKQRFEEDERLWAEAREYLPMSNFSPVEGSSCSRWSPQWNSEEDKTECKKMMAAIRKFETDNEMELTSRMHRLVNLMPYLWT